MVKCGCGREAKYELYETKQPHCLICLDEALEIDGQILVGMLDELAYARKDQGAK